MYVRTYIVWYNHFYIKEHIVNKYTVKQIVNVGETTYV